MTSTYFSLSRTIPSMLGVISLLVIASSSFAQDLAVGAQLVAEKTQQSELIVESQEIRSLPGSLDAVPVFNSNSPELVLSEGILLSTFPCENKADPTAHLSQPLTGDFDIFAHHIAKGVPPADLRTLYLGILIYNPGRKATHLHIKDAASYLSLPDAPFISLPNKVDNQESAVFSGPGDRVTDAILRHKKQQLCPSYIKIAGKQYHLLVNLPIPVKCLEPPLNGRSLLVKLNSSSPVYVASMAMYAPIDSDGKERTPNIQEWQNLLKNSSLAEPRDKAPSPPGVQSPFRYGRVAGVAIGSKWQTKLYDVGQRKHKLLSIPPAGQSYSYIISSVTQATFGTGQVQSAPLIVRYPDTAYAAHGNYGVKYDLLMPLYNSTNETKTIRVALQTPIKCDAKKDSLTFYKNPSEQVFFRGTIRMRYKDDHKIFVTRYFHLVQKKGEEGHPLVQLTVKPNKVRQIRIEFLYPPDATPPQVLTVKTLSTN